MKAKIAALAVAVFCGAAMPIGVASAQSYPTGPVRILVASAAGGSLDALARVVAEGLSEALGQPFVVEARPGAGGNLAIEAMLKAPADGHTLLFSGVGVASNPSLYKSVPFQIGDLTAISLVGEAPLFVMVNPAVPANTIGELVALTKAKPKSIRSAVLSGGSSQFACDMFKMVADVDVPNVAYKGGAQIFTDLIGGHVEAACLPVPESMPHVNSKRVRALAQTGTKRSPLAPEIPTLDEAGIKGASLTAWYMVTGPAKMPREVALKLNQEITKVLKKPQTQSKVASLGIDIIFTDVDQATAFLKSEHDKFVKLVRWSGAKVE